jgi:hypothetical protein
MRLPNTCQSFSGWANVFGSVVISSGCISFLKDGKEAKKIYLDFLSAVFFSSSLSLHGNFVPNWIIFIASSCGWKYFTAWGCELECPNCLHFWVSNWKYLGGNVLFRRFHPRHVLDTYYQAYILGSCFCRRVLIHWVHSSARIILKTPEYFTECYDLNYFPQRPGKYCVNNPISLGMCVNMSAWNNSRIA